MSSLTPTCAVVHDDATEAAWDRGHADGVAGRAAMTPTHYRYGECVAYCDGWRAGDAEFRDRPDDSGAPASFPGGFAPSPADEAWWAGFSLGIDGIPAVASPDLDDARRAAFESGLDIGHARFVEDCERDYHEWLDRMDSAFGDPLDLVNEAERDRAYGHRAFELAG